VGPFSPSEGIVRSDHPVGVHDPSARFGHDEVIDANKVEFVEAVEVIGER